MPLDDRVEYGSEFHWFDAGATPPAQGGYAWGQTAALFGSGRDAMRVLLAWGAREHGWRRVWLPSFYCQDVPAALRELSSQSVELRAYADAPDQEEPAIEAIPVDRGDVIVVLNHYGVRRPPAVLDALAGDAVIIEDHSHDLASRWAVSSTAHYAVASLRKTLPVPDGGVAWSPRGLELPAEPPLTDAHAVAALDRLSAMVLKARYLAGHAIDKDTFRAPALRAEKHIADGKPSGMTPVARAVLPLLPVLAWRDRRRENHETLLRALGPLSDVRFIEAPAGTVPFALTLVFDAPKRRDDVRQALIAARVYPVVLWPLDDPAIDGIPLEHVDLARRVLSIQCDQRYVSADMIRVAEIARPILRDGLVPHGS